VAQIALRFDMRNRAGGPTATADLYRACLDQCAWADRVGLDYAVISEHHGAEDGFLPAPLTLAGSIVGRTRRLPVVVAALLAPVNDPVRTAEELAVLDLVSGGRVAVVLGAGYRPEEFDMYGVDRSQRGRLLEEFVEVLRQAWTGEPFEWRGRTVRVTPRPHTQPHPTIVLGGSAPVSARRAARLRLAFFPAVDDPALADIYRQECAALGFEGVVNLPRGPGFVHVSDDPERDWARLAPYVVHDATTYASWQTPEVRSSVHVSSEELGAIRASGVYRVVTPEECLALAEELGPAGSVVLHPLLAGMPPELGWESLERFERQVLPRLRPAGAARDERPSMA
jgi:alkanesulfonate monooxygenase SsuD/methylene tetrahydromethanopterin reductase-like flavin-dependent oxidoreductase (luciferase family)